MPKANTTWTVTAHEPIEVFHDRLWRVEGSLPKMDLRRVMTLARMSDDKLLIHNGIALDEASMKRIEAWGTPTWLIVPNGFHRLDAPAFKARYPQIKVLCPRGARKKVEEVVPVDGTYEDLPADPFVRLEILDGMKEAEGVLHVNDGHGDHTLVFNDAVFNMPHVHGFVGFVLKHITASTGGPKVSNVARFFLFKDKAAAGRHLLRLADTPGLRRIIVSHHQTITTDPAETLRAVARTL